MVLPPVNDDWRLSRISSLYSTIDFLKGETNDRNNYNYDEESYSSENENNDHQKLRETYIDQHKKRIDDRFITSRTK